MQVRDCWIREASIYTDPQLQGFTEFPFQILQVIWEF